ncbi:unnamed protein product [Rhizophagus irregularis]|nr:unnamed protein product [Rhizophagus irregularis]
MTPFKPIVSSRNTATLIDNKLYILGGYDDSGTIPVGKEFFYLDLSVPFNTQNLLWHDLSNINIIQSIVAATSVNGGINNNTLIMYGGRNLTKIENLALVYMFDTQSNSWSKIVEDSYVSRKRSLSAVVDYDRKMYLFGGWLINNEYTNDMFILDTINLSWRIGSSLNAPVPMINYGATLLPNKNIIYIGGMIGSEKKNESLALNDVYLYDTINDKWSIKKTSGPSIPSKRFGLSVVLGLDGKQVIIFGGKENTIINPKKSLYNLNINTFEWSIPNVSGGISKSRYFHKAHVIGKYMVISFGMGYDKSVESDILLLDINNNNEYKWTTIFDPSTPPSPSSPFLPSLRPSTNPKTLSRITPAAMAGAIIGSLFGVILLSFGSYFLYKWSKNNQNQKHITRTILIPHSYSNC